MSSVGWRTSTRCLMPLCGGVFVNIALTQHDWLNKVSNTIPNTANKHSGYKKCFWHGVKCLEVMATVAWTWDVFYLSEHGLPGACESAQAPELTRPSLAIQLKASSLLHVCVCLRLCACVCVFIQYVSVSAVSVCLKAPRLLCDFCTSNRGEPIYSAIHKPHGDTSPPSPHLCSRGSGDVGCSPAPPALCQSLVPYTGRY